MGEVVAVAALKMVAVIKLVDAGNVVDAGKVIAMGDVVGAGKVNAVGKVLGKMAVSKRVLRHTVIMRYCDQSATRVGSLASTK